MRKTYTFAEAWEMMRNGVKMQPENWGATHYFECRNGKLWHVLGPNYDHLVADRDYVREQNDWVVFGGKIEEEKKMENNMPSRFKFTWGYVDNYSETAPYSAVYQVINGYESNTAILPSFEKIQDIYKLSGGYAQEPNKIKAIQTLRMVSNLGLREAKEIIEKIGMWKEEPKEFVFVRSDIAPEIGSNAMAMEIKITAMNAEQAEFALNATGVVAKYWTLKK